jgi:hypothetical protein
MWIFTLLRQIQLMILILMDDIDNYKLSSFLGIIKRESV